jgi:hypothetical protein
MNLPPVQAQSSSPLEPLQGRQAKAAPSPRAVGAGLPSDTEAPADGARAGFAEGSDAAAPFSFSDASAASRAIALLIAGRPSAALAAQAAPAPQASLRLLQGT